MRLVLPLTNTNARIAKEVEWNVVLSQSCVWTCRPSTGVVMTMDEGVVEIVEQLCTRTGMIMEDVSVVALTIGSLSGDDRLAAIVELESASVRINALVSAVRALSPEVR